MVLPSGRGSFAPGDRGGPPEVCVACGPAPARKTTQRYVGAQRTRAKCRRCFTVLSRHTPPVAVFPALTDPKTAVTRGESFLSLRQIFGGVREDAPGRALLPGERENRIRRAIKSGSVSSYISHFLCSRNRSRFSSLPNSGNCRGRVLPSRVCILIEGCRTAPALRARPLRSYVSVALFSRRKRA